MVQLWRSAAKANIEILQHFQLKVLDLILNAPMLITNEVIHRQLKIPTVVEEIKKHSNNYPSKRLS